MDGLEAAATSAVAALVTAALPLVLAIAVRLRQRRVRRTQMVADQASQQVARRVGANPDLTGLVVHRDISPHNVMIAVSDSAEVARRVDAAMHELAGVAERLKAHEVAADQLQARLRSVEDKFPDASEFQKYADANQLFLAYQLGEVTKRLERIERGQITRLQVVGIVIATLVAAVAATSGAVVLLQAAHVLH